MERTILQSVGNILFDPRWKVFNVCISNPGILELADIETKLFNHRLEASNSQLRVRVLKINLIVAVIADKEIGNGQMSDANPCVGSFVSI